MKIFILLGNSNTRIVANASNAMKIHKNIIYREQGLCFHGERTAEVMHQYQNFNIAREVDSGVVVAFRDKEPTGEEIQKALNDAHESHPWMFVTH